MKTFNALGFGAIVVLGAAGAWLGCDSTNAPLAPAPADAGAASDAKAASDAAVVALTCPAYCTDIMNTCTADAGEAQYNPAVAQECASACSFFPVGDAGATSGDSLACRIYHTGLAMTLPNPHCWHAGPFGFGTCGDECEAFCNIAMGYCSPTGGFDGGAPPYASQTDCMTACDSYARVNGADGGPVGLAGGYNSAGPTTGDTLDCREWHLGKALESATLQQVHCNHVGVVSATCFAAPADAGAE